MNPRNTAILALVAAALGAFLWFYELEGEEGRREAEAREKQLFPELSASAVDWLALTTSDGTALRAERRDGSWWITEPLEFPGDDFALDAVASAVAEMGSEAAYEEPQADAVYGLDDEALLVRVGSEGAEHALRTGDRTPMGSNTYARVEGEATVYTVPTFRVNSLRKTFTDLRDKRILDVDAASVRGVVLRWPGGRVELERDGGSWRMRAPMQAPADDAAVKDLLSDLSFLRAAAFADDPPPDAETGLAEPALEVELSVAPEDGEGDPGSVGLAIGAREVDGQRFVRAGRPTLYRVAAARLNDFPREAFAYRFKELSRFGSLDAQRVELEFRDGGGAPTTVTATRDGSRWSVEPEPVEPAKVGTLVEALSRLDASGLLAESVGEPERRALGLDPPRVAVRVYGRADEAGDEGEGGAEGGAGSGDAAAEPALLAELHLGAVQGSEAIAARRPGDDAVYALDYALAERIPVSLEALRNRFLVQADPEADPEAEAGTGAAEGALSPDELAELLEGVETGTP